MDELRRANYRTIVHQNGDLRLLDSLKGKPEWNFDFREMAKQTLDGANAWTVMESFMEAVVLPMQEKMGELEAKNAKLQDESRQLEKEIKTINQALINVWSEFGQRDRRGGWH
jgi:hypothetical protein